MEHTVITQSKGNMAFDSQVDGYAIGIDAHKEFGGTDAGPTPKPLLLTSLSGCTAMDVVSLLKKMRVEITDFYINATGHLTDEHPKYYDTIHLEYVFEGDNLDEAKIKKAVALSQERYCGVMYMLSQSSTITTEIKLNDTVAASI